MTVPYRGGRTITNLCKVGEYDWIHPDITDKNFLHERTGDEEIEIELVCFDHDVEKEEVISVLRSHGLRPANMAELLALGVRYPFAQKSFPIVALGEMYFDIHVGVGCLMASTYSVGICSAEDTWGKSTRFAGVKGECDQPVSLRRTS